MILQGILHVDKGVQSFKTDKGTSMDYRQLVIVESGNPELVKVSVPVDYKAPKAGDPIKLEVFASKVRLA